MTSMIPCPDCNASGDITGLVCGPDGGSIRTMPCFRCKGERAIPSEQAEWIRCGELLRRDRIAHNVGGRERAQMLGITPLSLNDIEHGKVNPREVLRRIYD